MIRELVYYNVYFPVIYFLCTLGIKAGTASKYVLHRESALDCTAIN